MARVLLFEDDPNMVMLAGFAIEDSGHELVATADSITKAQGFLAQLIRNEIQADVLLLDGNLDRSDKPSTFRVDGLVVEPDNGRSLYADARMITNIIAKSELNLPTIGISGDEMELNGVTVDYDLGKMFLGRPNPAEELNTAINAVLHKQ